MLSIDTHFNFTVSPDCLIAFIKLDSCKCRNLGSAFALSLFHFLHLVFALATTMGNLSSFFLPCLSAKMVLYVSANPCHVYFNIFLHLAYFCRSGSPPLCVSQMEFIPYMICMGPDTHGHKSPCASCNV